MYSTTANCHLTNFHLDSQKSKSRDGQLGKGSEGLSN
jgi:hypothetical protein